jgi:hypothetical protein
MIIRIFHKIYLHLENRGIWYAVLHHCVVSSLSFGYNVNDECNQELIMQLISLLDETRLLVTARQFYSAISKLSNDNVG